MIDTILMGLMLLISALVFFYAKSIGADEEKLEDAVERLTAENEAIRARMRVYEKRLHRQAQPEKLIITHEYDDSDAPKYGNF